MLRFKTGSKPTSRLRCGEAEPPREPDRPPATLAGSLRATRCGGRLREALGLMNDAWTAAVAHVERLAKELSGKPLAEILAMPYVASSDREDTPADFQVTIEHAPMLNGTSSVTVEAGKFVLLGFRWRSVVAGFEITPDGELKHYPLRHVNISARERKRQSAWIS